MNQGSGLSRATLRWLTVWAPLVLLGLLAAAWFLFHPRPVPLALQALVVAIVLLGVGAAGLFSRFVFTHLQRQEAELVTRIRELAEARQAMVVMNERQRIARDLHDSLAQSLGYLHLGLAAIERRIAAGETGTAGAELAELKRVARGAYEEARQAIFGLRGMVSCHLGLVPILTEYLHEWSRQTGVPVDLRVAAEEDLRVSPAAEVQLVGIVQEALTNVRKHARAPRVGVRLERDGTTVRCAISDDGVGFDPAEVAARQNTCFGLETMRQRAEAVGAKLTVTSGPGRGTTVAVDIPVGGSTGAGA